MKQGSVYMKRLVVKIILFFCLDTCCSGSNKEDLIIGSFTVFNRNSRYVIAAPHGEFDENTSDIVWKFCQKLKWDCLISEGFRNENTPINVNRPTEGVSLSEVEYTKRAEIVYESYIHKIQKLNPSTRLYVEIHGQNSKDVEDKIEIATSGISTRKAKKIQEIFDREIKKTKFSQFRVSIDLLDDIKYKASHSKKFGALSFLKPGLHIELPLTLRTDLFNETVSFLTNSLSKVAKVK